MMRTIERKQIALALTDAHPLNREFPTKGEAWDEFEDDIAARGIQEDLVVRWAPELNDRYQVLRGHRRRYAGLRRKVKEAWVVLVDCSDEEAFDHMWGENFFRENINPADEAQAVRVMLGEFGKTVEELAEKWKRSVEWIRTRQGLLELGDEVMEAVRGTGRDRLSMGAVEQILKVPAEMRDEAVRLVLHPELDLGVLDEGQARDVLRKCLLEPKAKEVAWEAMRPKIVKGWRKDLEKLCLPKTKGDMLVSSKGLVEAQGLVRGYVAATERVPLASVLPSAPEVAGGLLWLHLAVKHTLPVIIVPGAEPGESRAIVHERILTDAEAAMAECGGGNWLVVGKGRTSNIERRTSNVEEEEGKRIEKAKADVEAGFDTAYPTGETPETVMEQHVERAAMIDYTAVRNVALWAVSADADPMNAPEWVPKWACKLGIEGMWTEIDAITSWVMDLRK